jgi:ribosomal protein S18 acetylase RimI-like enzyme
MTAAELEWRVEETCLNAWPALRQVLLDGWVLRFSEGLTRRANSANPLRGPRETGDCMIAACEALYQSRGLPTIFRLPSIIEPDLDERLEALGYGREGESCVRYGDLTAIEAASDADVQLLMRPTREWFAAMAALQNHTPEQRRIYRRILGTIAIPAVFAGLAIGGQFVALAYGAIHDRLLCYESVITDPHRQRRGYARRVVTSLAAWAGDQGAEGACLEVEAHNAAALALYDGVGLKTELYRYRYRREPSPARRDKNVSSSKN